MKKLLAIAVLFSGQAFAAPFLVSDPDPAQTADQCIYQEGSAAAVVTPTVGFACHADLSGVTTGSHTFNVSFKSSQWGIQSVPVPFTFARPALISSPATIRLAP